MAYVAQVPSFGNLRRMPSAAAALLRSAIKMTIANALKEISHHFPFVHEATTEQVGSMTAPAIAVRLDLRENPGWTRLPQITSNNLNSSQPVNTAFPCYLVEKTADGVSTSLTERTIEDLPQGDTVIRVAYSSLNYKDALAVQGHSGVVSKFPHVPGIDASGVVESCASGAFAPGDEVIVTGYGLGDEDWGGYAGYIRVPAEWVVPLPAGLSLYDAMIYGTAGITAARGIDHLRNNDCMPDSGEVVVTGATGGVGSLAVAMLARLGYDVVAVTGKESAHGFLTSLGAKRIVGREEVNDASDAPLLKGKWAGAVDTVGGNILSTIIRSARQHATVTCCGLVAGAEFNTTVYPFILRGVRLIGIDSDQCPMPKRHELWRHMATDWRPDGLESLARTVNLDGLSDEVASILKGGITGRVVVQPVREG